MIKLACAFTLFAALTVPASATVLYEFLPAGGTYNSSGAANTNFRNVDGTQWVAASANRAYSTNVMSPAGDYSGPTFYGGFGLNSASEGLWNAARVRHDAATAGNRRAEVIFDADRTANEAGSLSLFMAFDISTTALEDFTSITASGGRVGRSNLGQSISLAVQVGSQWYVNNAAATNSGLTTSSTLSFTTITLASSLWTEYDPTAGLAAPTGGTVSLAGDAQIARMGILSTVGWAAGWADDFTGTQMNSLISAVQVSAVPEPASATLLLGSIGTILLLRGRRSHRRQK